MARGLEDRLALERLPVGQWLDAHDIAWYLELTSFTAREKARTFARDGLLVERQIRPTLHTTRLEWLRRR